MVQLRVATNAANPRNSEKKITKHCRKFHLYVGRCGMPNRKVETSHATRGRTHGSDRPHARLRALYSSANRRIDRHASPMIWMNMTTYSPNVSVAAIPVFSDVSGMRETSSADA